MRVTVQAYAKLNLLLEIVGRLPIGYHDLHMIMQSVDLHDTVTVEPGAHALVCSDPAVPTDERNIAWKAAAAFEKATGKSCGEIRITIRKRIPSAAGLAGGSADGAAVLAALDRLHETHLSQQALCRIGASVGADVPFCLTGGTALALHIGDVLAPLPPFDGGVFVLAKPACGVSTAEAYALFDRARDLRRPDFRTLLSAAAQGDWDSVLRGTCNTFEQLIEVADRVPIKAALRRAGCTFSMMSGSGPTVFGVFRERAAAQNAAETLRGFVSDVFVCAPTPHGLDIHENTA